MALFQPLSFSNFTLSNRIVVSPMCQYSAHAGYPNDWHLVHLGQFAIGKAGAVIQEATAVSPEGRISYGDLGIWEDGQVEHYEKITDFIQSQGSIPGIQLAHAGRKASTEIPWIGRNQIHPDETHGWESFAPSPAPYHPQDHASKALSLDEIEQIIEQFRQAARRATRAGYQIIEIHAAHGYLIHQFLSPLVNKRVDLYGGSFENRIRLLMQIVQAVQSELTGKQSLWVRISATDWVAGGWDLAQSIELSHQLRDAGVALIDVSSGGAVPEQRITVGPGYQVPFSEAIKKATGMRTGAVGIISQAEQAEAILTQDSADIILIGRAFLRNPHLVLDWAKALQIPFPWPNPYDRAR